MTSKRHPTADDSFGNWIGGLWRERFARIAALATATNLLFAVAKQLPLESVTSSILLWFDSISHLLQAIVILVLLGVLYKGRYARLKDAGRESSRFCTQIQNHFYMHWRYLWLAWFLLYMILVGYGFAFRNKIDQTAFPGRTESTVRNAIRELEDGKKSNEPDGLFLMTEIRPILLYQDAIGNLFNNFQTLFVFCCYHILLCRRDPATGDPVPPPIPYYSLLLFVFSFAEFIGIIGGVHQHNLEIFRWLSAFAGGVALAMLVGRLESRRIDAPLSLICILYFYAVSQPAWALGGAEAITIFRSVMFSLFLVLKVALFLYVLWLLQTGRMLYYITSIVEAEKQDEKTRHRFLNEQVVRN